MSYFTNYHNKVYNSGREFPSLRLQKKTENNEDYQNLIDSMNQNFKSQRNLRSNQRKNNIDKELKESNSKIEKKVPILPLLSNRPSNKKFPNLNQIIIIKTSMDDIFVNKFKNAIKNCKSGILNQQKCIQTLDDNTYFPKNIKNITNDNIQSKSPSASNGERYSLKTTKKKELNLIDKNREVESVKKTLDLSRIDMTKDKKQMSKLDNEVKTKLKKKFVEKLKNCLKYLYYNNITIEKFHKSNPFPRKPLRKQNGKEFLESVKLGDIKKVSEYLLIDRSLIYEKDNLNQTGYHWSAKRGHLSIMIMLYKIGNHPNLVDIQFRTPLYFASMNNHSDVVEFLLKNNANPFMKCSNGKKPIDLTSDVKIKRILESHMKAEKNWDNIFDIIRYHNGSNIKEVLKEKEKENQEN